MEGKTSATRIFIGGLGERVTEDDIRKTFSNLGSLEAVEIIRTKGRSFAYINFLPSSDNSLNKLFSMYNGCSWKGGKLKLEKAKEHYVDRLQREWAEDAELENSEHIEPTNDDDENMAASVEPKSSLDLEKAQIHMFFPKLRKMRSLPLRGSGKHKYSFQRLQVPCLPIHICDCCLENSDPSLNPPQKFTDIQDAGINEEEINMMNLVMNRVLNKRTCSAPKHSQSPKEREAQASEIQDGGVNEEEINLMDSVMRKIFQKGSSSKTEQKGVRDFPMVTSDVDDATDDDDDDDDDIQINVGAGEDDEPFSESWKVQTKETYPQQSNQIDTNDIDDGTDIDDDDDDDIKINTGAGQDDDPFSENWEMQTNLGAETAKSNEDLTVDGLAAQATQEEKAKSSNKKRKSLSDETNENKTTASSSMLKKKARLQTQSNESEELLENPKTKSSKTGMWSQKSPWKQLVEDGGKTSSFRMSHITPESKSKNLVPPTTGNETLSNSCEHEKVNSELHENSDEQEESQESPATQAPDPTPEPSLGVDKSIIARGSSWLQKSSWTNLVSGDSVSSFSISQIVPEKFLEKQETRKPNTFLGTGATKSKKTGTALDGSRSSKPFLFAHTKKNEQPSTSVGTTEKKSGLEQMKASNLVPGIGLGVRISETCPFMRNTDSVSGAAKKRKKQ